MGESVKERNKWKSRLIVIRLGDLEGDPKTQNQIKLEFYCTLVREYSVRKKWEPVKILWA